MFFTVLDFLLAAGAVMMLSVHTALVFGVLRAHLTERRLKVPAVRIPVPPEAGPAGSAGSEIPVSVLVPARNEAQHLPGLFESLSAQDAGEFEIVFVNDRSTDRTAELLSEFAAARPGRVKIVTLTENPSHTNPKQYALARGAERATGELLLLTDADCRFGPNWISAIREAFAEPSLGIAFGPVVTPADSPLSRYQAFDHLFRYFYTAATAGLGMPSGGFGNNFAVRSRALAEAGGFEGLPPSPTEDAALIAAVRDRTRFKTAGFTSPRTAVLTAPEPDLPSLTRQELRWNTGGIFAPDFPTRAGYRLVMFYLTAGMLLLPFSPLYPPLALTAVSAGLSMLMMALAAGAFASRAVPGYFFGLVPNLAWSMGYYSWITILTLMKRPVVWKGSVLERR